MLHGGDAQSAPVPPDIEVREFDPASGILTRRFAPFGDLPAELAYAVFDRQGRPLGGCNVSVSPFACTEWVRDAHGNVIAFARPNFTSENFMLTLLDANTFGTRVRGTVAERYTLTYDDAGTLSSSRYMAGTIVQLFTEDDQHRCSDVVWQTPVDSSPESALEIESERWTWEGDRLMSRVVTRAADTTDVRSVIGYSYEADGTLAATVVDGYPRFLRSRGLRGVRDGIADYVVRSVTVADGSRWVESLEFGSFDANANVVRNGKLEPANRLRWNYSPGCRGAEPPRRASQHCQFEPVANQLSVRWHDPYTTPIPR